MNMSMNHEGFDHAADACFKFHSAAGMFTIMLKDGSIVHHNPGNAESFRHWLLENNIQDIGNTIHKKHKSNR